MPASRCELRGPLRSLGWRVPGGWGGGERGVKVGARGCVTRQSRRGAGGGAFRYRIPERQLGAEKEVGSEERRSLGVFL